MKLMIVGLMKPHFRRVQEQVRHELVLVETNRVRIPHGHYDAIIVCTAFIAHNTSEKIKAVFPYTRTIPVNERGTSSVIKAINALTDPHHQPSAPNHGH